MKKCGEAAAVAAYLSITERVALKDIDYVKLQAMLEPTGCLDRDNDVGYINREYNGELKKVSLPRDCKEITDVLKTDKPDFAIWQYAFTNGKCAEEMRECVRSGDSLTRKKPQ